MHQRITRSRSGASGEHPIAPATAKPRGLDPFPRAMTSNREEMRKQMTGLAQAFFARGIRNFIGACWAVDDACAEECARWFYARLFGLRAPHASACDSRR
jgi:hypothetical protein